MIARRTLLLAPLAAMGPAACTDLFVPRTIDVPEARLQELVAKRFPITRRIADLIDVNIGAPRLSLQPEMNRVLVELALTAGNEATPRLSGVLAVSQGLRFEASDHTIRLVDVRVEAFTISGLPSSWQRQLERLGKPLAQALLENQVLYTLRPKDVALLEGRGVRPGDLRVTATGVTITLLPAGP